VPSPGDPQNLNRYAYVRNNPLKYTDPSGHALWAGEDWDLASDPESVLIREQAENTELLDRLARTHQYSELEKFKQLLHSIHPGSIGIIGAVNRFNAAIPGLDVGHAVIGTAEGVFIGTGNHGNNDDGVFFSSAAAAFEDGKWRNHLTIYEVEGLDDLAREDAARFAIKQYGSSYSYAGLIPFSDPTVEDKSWYCTELTVAALEHAGVTFYVLTGSSPPILPLQTSTFPTYLPNYRTLVRGQNLVPSSHSRWGNTQPLLQTWP